MLPAAGFFYLTFMRAKHGGVPQAATRLSEAREEAERLASPGTRVGKKIAPEKPIEYLSFSLYSIISIF